MNMNQKGFTNIILTVVIVAIVAVGGYFFFKKSTNLNNEVQSQASSGSSKTINDLNWQGKGATYLPEEDHIQVLFPKGGEKLEVGKTYDIKWTNYPSKEALNIVLHSITPSNKVSTKLIASNVPAASNGSYKWIVTTESAENRYKIEVYPPGGRELVGRSDNFFSIFGEQLITVTSPQPNDRLNITQPIVIMGKAKKVFGEGEFDIVASYSLDGKKQVVARTFAKCADKNNCDWLSGNFVDFTATIDLSSAPVCGVNVDFYKRDDSDSKTISTQPFYMLPFSLYGNENCQ